MCKEKDFKRSKSAVVQQFKDCSDQGTFTPVSAQGGFLGTQA